MSTPVFQTYDRAALDAEYDNRAKVSDFAAYIDAYEKQSADARQLLACQLNVKYGQSDAETLDVFGVDLPANSPLHVFYHGGYWKALSKDEFSFVANGFAEHGIRTAVVNYALIPDVDMAELIRQCRAALAYLWRNADDLSIDRNAIHISGHSAGGHIVGMMMATNWPAFEAMLPAQIISSGVSLSGLMDLEPISKCFLNDDLHLTDSDVEQFSPLGLTPSVSRPFSLLVGGDEGEEYHRQSASLVDAWAAQPIAPVMDSLPGHNHFSIINTFNDSQDSVTQRLVSSMLKR